MSDKNSGKKWALGTMIAAVAGYVTGVLTAPKAGKDTRDDIKEKAASVAIEGEEKLEQLRDQLDEAVAKAKNEGEELTGRAKDQLAKASDVAVKAKDKAKDVLTAVRDGNSDDANLKKAIAEADKALSELKKFLKK